MADLRTLDPDTRTLALVGYFLQCWAYMERGIDKAIGVALNVNPLTEVIISSNISFLQKANILEAICSLTAGLSDDEKASAKSLLGRIKNHYGERNMVAHDLFLPSEKIEGVEFLTVRAKGKVVFPDAHWSVERFYDLGSAFIEYRKELDNLESKLRAASGLDVNSLAALLSAIPPPPTGGFSGSTIPDHPSPQLPEYRTSETTAAIPETASETSPSPQE